MKYAEQRQGPMALKLKPPWKTLTSQLKVQRETDFEICRTLQIDILPL